MTEKPKDPEKAALPEMVLEQPKPKEPQEITLVPAGPKPVALKNNIAFLEECIAYGGMGEVWRAHRGNAMSMLAERMVWGEENPSLFGVNIPFEAPSGDLSNWNPKPITDEAQIKQIYKGAIDMWDEYLKIRAKDPKTATEAYRGLLELIDPYFLENEKLAVKVLKPHTSKALEESVKKEYQDRFYKENLMLRRLQHPGIVRRFGLVDDPKMGWCLLLEYIDGTTLEDFSRKFDKHMVPLDVVAGIGRQLGEALHYAHKQGIIHRDLKPSNIMIRKDGTIVITDFGIGKWRDEEPDQGLTMPGQIIGTPQYMAPEQARSEPPTTKTDVFQLGTLLFTLATGKKAYEQTDITSIVNLLSDLGLPHPAYVWDHIPTISPELGSVIEVARAKNPDDRWDMSEFVIEVSGVAEQGLFHSLERTDATSTQLRIQVDHARRKRKQLRHEEQKLETRLHYKTLEESIEDIRELYSKGKLEQAKDRVEKLSKDIPNAQRYEPLKAKLASLGYDIGLELSSQNISGMLAQAQQQYDIKDYVAFGDELKKAEEHMQDVKEKHPELYKLYEQLKGKFEPFSSYVELFRTLQNSFINNINEGIDAIQKSHDAPENRGKITKSQFTTLFEKLKAAQELVKNLSQENIGIKYEQTKKMLEDQYLILTGLQKRVFPDV